MSKKDRTPAEIAEIRKQREHRRMWRALGLWLAWLVVFTVGWVLDSETWIGLAFILSMADLAVINGLYEKSLRKIARPVVDYNRVRKLEKRELPIRGDGAENA